MVRINYYPIPGLAVNTQDFWNDTNPLSIQPYLPSRDGRTFLGWSKNEDASTIDYLTTKKYNFSGSIGGFEIYNLYGVWATLYWFNIFLDMNGGINSNGNTSGINCSYSSEQQKTYFTFPNETPTREGYKFLGWSTDSQAIKAQYVAGDKIELIGIEENEEYEWNNFYAVWVEVYTVIVEYDANGGVGAPNSESFVNEKSSTVSITISTISPTLEDYSFAGWGNAASNPTLIYDASKTYPINVTDSGRTTKLKLYAVWKEKLKGNYVYIVIKDNTLPIQATPLIYDGSKWVQALAQVYSGSGWNPG